jgi:hypothetical protein
MLRHRSAILSTSSAIRKATAIPVSASCTETGKASSRSFAPHPPSPVLVAFAPDENRTAARPEKSIAKAMKKAALKHKTPVGRPTPSPPADKPPQLRPWPETAPM